MRTTSPLLGRKFGEGRLRRHREAVARRKAEGFYEQPPYTETDPRTEVRTVTCASPECGREFTFTFSPRFSRDANRYCSHLCQLRHNHILRTRCPQDYETLHDLYVKQNMTTVEIGNLFGVSNSTVRIAMIKAGVPRRGMGTRPKEKACKATSGR